MMLQVPEQPLVSEPGELQKGGSERDDLDDTRTQARDI
jgi:hypothetical protein